MCHMTITKIVYRHASLRATPKTSTPRSCRVRRRRVSVYRNITRMGFSRIKNMSIQYCFDCDEHIDTDFNAEHFDGEECSITNHEE